MVVVDVDDGHDDGGSGGIVDVKLGEFVLLGGVVVTIMKEVECLFPFTIEGTGFIVAYSRLLIL
jgi:hypothetical protein